MTAVGNINAAKIRAGQCWECDQKLEPLPSWPLTRERWTECVPCRRRFLVISDLLVVERMQVVPELVGRPVENLWDFGGSSLVRWDGSAVREGLIPADAWFESPITSEASR